MRPVFHRVWRVGFLRQIYSCSVVRKGRRNTDSNLSLMLVDNYLMLKDWHADISQESRCAKVVVLHPDV
jgi:flagellar assembly factor FliW